MIRRNTDERVYSRNMRLTKYKGKIYVYVARRAVYRYIAKAFERIKMTLYYAYYIVQDIQVW